MQVRFSTDERTAARPCTPLVRLLREVRPQYYAEQDPGPRHLSRRSERMGRRRIYALEY